MTLLSEWAAQTYHTLSLHYPWFNFVIPPIGLGFTAWVTFRFFPGSEYSRQPIFHSHRPSDCYHRYRLQRSDCFIELFFQWSYCGHRLSTNQGHNAQHSTDGTFLSIP